MLKVFAPAYAMIALALALTFSGCSQTAFNQGLANMQAATQSAVALNNALVQIDITIVNNLTAQAKLLAPYQCGAYALAASILSDSSAAAKVNAYLAKDLAANVANVAVKDICTAAGYPATVTAAPAASATPAASAS
jgi:hypothetical protein